MKKIIIFLAFCVLAENANAVSLYCGGYIKSVLVRDSGEVVISSSWHPSYTKVCDLNSDSPGTVTCSMWASYAAQAVEANIEVKHSLDVPEGMTCDTLPAFSNTPKTRYLMLINK